MEQMTKLMEMQAQAFNDVMLTNTNRGSTLTDTRGIGRRTCFKGDEGKFTEWIAKLNAYLRVSHASAADWLDWACKHDSPVSEDIIDDEAPGADTRMVKDFSTKLFATLISCTEEDAFRIVNSVKSGFGLEAYRLLKKRYEPKTPGTKRALLKTIINNPQSKRVNEVEANLMHVEELIKKYELMAGTNLPDDLKVTILIDLCHSILWGARYYVVCFFMTL